MSINLYLMDGQYYPLISYLRMGGGLSLSIEKALPLSNSLHAICLFSSYVSVFVFALYLYVVKL